MIILTLKTDNPEAEVGLFEGHQPLGYDVWQAHRQLSATLHAKIESLLSAQAMGWGAIEGIVCFEGPGSFTGLRIGLATGNAFAYGLSVPIVAIAGDDWKRDGIERLQAGDYSEVALPNYGTEAHITLPRK